MVSKVRIQRIADRIRNDLSELLLHQISDPRLNAVSVTDVMVDRELAFADIYVSALEGEVRSKEILEVFIHAQGYIRRELAKRIALRTFPRLRFHWDPTFERADNLERLFNRISMISPIDDSTEFGDEENE